MLNKLLAAAAAGVLLSCTPAPPSRQYLDLKAAVRTQPVATDPDDPAIWVHPNDASKSLILGTNKVKAPDGAVVVYNLDGSVRQTVSGLDRPNNVDIEGDLAVVAERLKNQLRFFQVTAEGITDSGSARVFADRSGEEAAPMGIALYRRPKDGVLFAIVAPKAGPRNGYLGQYRIENKSATFVRYFGTFSGAGEIEAVAVDDALGFVYYADEGNGIHKYHADPDHPDASREVAHFGRTGFNADREGIAIYARADGTGYIVCTDQIEGNAEYHVYRREGDQALVTVIRGGADSTDGLEVISTPLGPHFPQGLMVAMNSKDRNFLMYRWPESLR